MVVAFFYKNGFGCLPFESLGLYSSRSIAVEKGIFSDLVRIYSNIYSNSFFEQFFLANKMAANLKFVEVANNDGINPTAAVYEKLVLLPSEDGTTGGYFLYDRANRVVFRPVNRKIPECNCDRMINPQDDPVEFPKCLATPMTPKDCVRGSAPVEWEAEMRIFMRLRIMSVMKWVIDPQSLPRDFEFAKYSGEGTRRAVYSYLFEYPGTATRQAVGNVMVSHVTPKMAKCGETGKVSQFHKPLPIMAKDAAGADLHDSAARTVYINRIFNDEDFLYEQYSLGTAVDRTKVSDVLRRLLEPVVRVVRARGRPVRARVEPPVAVNVVAAAGPVVNIGPPVVNIGTANISVNPAVAAAVAVVPVPSTSRGRRNSEPTVGSLSVVVAGPQKRRRRSNEDDDERLYVDLERDGPLATAYENRIQQIEAKKTPSPGAAVQPPSKKRRVTTLSVDEDPLEGSSNSTRVLRPRAKEWKNRKWIVGTRN